MSLIFGILVFGALLAAVFGRRVGAMFVTGAGMLIIAGIGLVSIAFIWFLVANGFFSDRHSSSASSSYSNYGSSYGASPAYGSSTPSQTYTPRQSYAPVTQSPESTPTNSSSLSSSLPSSESSASVTGPRLGVDLVDMPAGGTQVLAYLHPPPNTGAWIRVHPGSVAEAEGLRSYDVILSAGTQTEQPVWITPSIQLPNYLDHVGYNIPVRLHVYRATVPCDFWIWVHPR